MNKQYLIKKLIGLKKRYPKSYTRTNEMKLYKNHIYKFSSALNKFNSNMIERIYFIINDMEDRPVCLVCGSYVNFTNGLYSTYCSNKCINIKTLEYRKCQFIEKSNKVHNNKYDYSFVEYKNNSKNVDIICPIHGVFSQKPNNHLNGKGCKKCVIDVWDTKTFIEKAKKIHGDTYDYSLSEYKYSTSKIKIICKKHGEFYIKSISHLMGKGCIKCGREKSNWNMLNYYRQNKNDAYKMGTLYFVQLENKETGEILYKIGITRRTIDKRFQKINKLYNINVIYNIKMSNIKTSLYESFILKKFKDYKYIPHLKFEGWTECFKDKIDIKNYIKNLDFNILCKFYKKCDKYEWNEFKESMVNNSIIYENFKSIIINRLCDVE